MIESNEQLRIAFVAGSLGQGGAEKQLVYMARALQGEGVDLRVYSLGRGEYHESSLMNLDIRPDWVGRFGSPMMRLGYLTRAIHQFRPHILQSTHFFANLYAAVPANFSGAISIGSIRGDTYRAMKANGVWGPWLLRMPSALIVNSITAMQNARSIGVDDERIYVLPNVIDLREFDSQITAVIPPHNGNERVDVITVARLIQTKRVDRFLRSLALARREVGELRGVIVGDGPEKSNLMSLAGDLGLLPEGVIFLGLRNDVNSLLSSAKIFIFTSEHEGFPNVLLEAMAARLPVITTPAGDSSLIVQNNVTGFVIQQDDNEGLVDCLLQLAKSPELRLRLGDAGRQRVEQNYSYDGLSDRLLSIYSEIAKLHGNHDLLKVMRTDHAKA